MNKKKGSKKKQPKDEESKYKTMIVWELKDLCRSRGLGVGWIKSTQIVRLEVHACAKAGEDDGNEEEGDDADADKEDGGGDNDSLNAGQSNEANEHDPMLAAYNDISNLKEMMISIVKGR